MDKEAMELNNDEQVMTFSEEEANKIRQVVARIQSEVKEELEKSRENQDKINETGGRSR